MAKLKQVAYRELFIIYRHIEEKMVPAIERELADEGFKWSSTDVDNDDYEIAVQCTPETATAVLLSDEITIEHLPLFAEYQRKYDALVEAAYSKPL